MHFADTFHDSCEQQRAEGHDMHGCQGVDELLIIAGQAMASPRPDTTPLHLPASWQQHEAFPGLGQPRHLKVQEGRFGFLRRVLPRLRLVDRVDLHGIAHDVLDLCGQRMHLVAVGLVGRGHRHGQQMTPRIDRLVPRRATAVCGPHRPVAEKSGDATGIGDIVLRAKYHLYKGLVADIAGALLLKLPTGDEDNFLGMGTTTLRPFLIVSRTFFDVFTPHLNLGYEIDFDRGHQDALHYIHSWL
jgi:outer membrane putative beta-barrel porin/alpha-amylase